MTTKHKKGADHWTADCKKQKDENERLRKLLAEVYEMCGGYYANFEEIRRKIASEGGLQ